MAMQRIRNVNPGWDSERIVELFRKAQVEAGTRAKSGFYEYSLSEEDMTKRIKACPELSLVLENSRGEFLAYLLAYPTCRIETSGLNVSRRDEVLKRLSGANSGNIYVDQLCLAQNIPIFVGARVVDVWTKLVHDEKLNGSVCAIPAKPWTNVASRRLALARGYSRVGQVQEIGITLDIFAKPHWQIDGVFNPYEDFLGLKFN